jgi:hypothetical protein
MKKITLSILVFFTLGCSEPNVKSTNAEITFDGYSEKVKTYEWFHKNHLYIIIKNKNSIGITHAGHCVCNK